MPERAADEPEQTHTDDQVEAIRSLTAEVWRRVQAWHDAPGWDDNERNRHRYELTAVAVARLEDLRERSLEATVTAVTPIVVEWRPSYAGPEQAIYAAVDRLRNAVRSPG